MNHQQWITQIITKWQADQLLAGIDQLLDQLFTTDISWEEKLDNSLSRQQQALLITALSENFLNSSPTTQERLLNQIKTQISQLPIVEIHIPKYLAHKHLLEISQWFEKNLNKHYLFDIRVYPSLLGGAVIKHAGFIKDYSLQHWLANHAQNGLLSSLLKSS